MSNRSSGATNKSHKIITPDDREGKKKKKRKSGQGSENLVPDNKNKDVAKASKYKNSVGDTEVTIDLPNPHPVQHTSKGKDPPKKRKRKTKSEGGKYREKPCKPTPTLTYLNRCRQGDVP